MKIGFVTNTLSTKKDDLTTHDIALAALNRGHRLYFMGVLDFYYFLSQACERAGDLRGALDNMFEVHRKNINWRDSREKFKALNEQLKTR